jgi:hypothetical protein
VGADKETEPNISADTSADESDVADAAADDDDDDDNDDKAGRS